MLEIRQWEQYEGEDWWKWAVWLEGSVQELNAVSYVDWILHPTFPHPVRRIDSSHNSFRLETGGWGVFPVMARVHMKDGSEVKLQHQLELHYPDGRSNHK